MAKYKTVCALDIGSSKIVAVLAQQDGASSKMRVLAGTEIGCRGLRAGVVVNIPETARAVKQAVELCEEKIKDSELAPAEELLIAVRGPHFKSFNNKSALNIARTDQAITEDDVDGVLENAHAVPMSQDREVLHIIPQDFMVDRQKGIPDPVGMEGALLEAEVHILTATSSHLNNIVKAVNQSGFRVGRVVFGLFALSEFVVAPEEREQGCLLLDVGGQTLGLGVFSEGALRHSKEIAMGSDYITKDLAYALRTSLVNAERLKEQHGACLTSLVTPDEEVEYRGVDGRELRQVKKRTIVEYIQPRVEEIFALVTKELESAGCLDSIVPGGAVITGGGSQLRGLVEASSELLGVPARPAIPSLESVEVPEDLGMDPTFATALAVLQYTERPPFWADKINGRNKKGFDGVVGTKARNGMTRRIQGFFEELFS